MYENTQKMFEGMGYGKDDTVTLYRGMKFNEEGGRRNAPPKELADLPENHPDENTEPSTIRGYDQQPLSSFSTSAGVAGFFAAPAGNEGEMAFQIAEEVPISRIVSTHQTGFGCMTEREMVVMPSAYTPEIKVWKQTGRSGSRPLQEQDVVPGYNEMTENGKWVTKQGTNDIGLVTDSETPKWLSDA